MSRGRTRSSSLCELEQCGSNVAIASIDECRFALSVQYPSASARGLRSYQNAGQQRYRKLSARAGKG
jgi:hypothetical protein